jgi:hypothetical protein
VAKVRDLIRGSLRSLGVIASGENPGSDEIQDGLAALNEMLDAWSTERLIIPSRTTEKFNLVSGQQLYTMGTGGNFNTARPMSIEAASIEIQGSEPEELPVCLLTEDQWARKALKTTESTYPTDIFIEDSFPLLKIHVYPVPTAVHKLVLYSAKPLENFESVNADVILPKGYAAAIRYNLALWLESEYGTQLSERDASKASQLKKSIKRQNQKTPLLRVDESLTSRGGFDWRTGE